MLIRSTNYNNSNMLNSLIEQQNKLYEIYNQVNSGKKFTNISENPMDSTSIIDLNKQLQKLATYESNINNATTQLDYQDEIFSTVIEKMQRINDLSIQAANGAGGTETINACKAEIMELKKKYCCSCQYTVQRNIHFCRCKYYNNAIHFRR